MTDLHSHSTASDGELEPAALVDRANRKGVELLALTDHDTLAGLDEALAAAHDLRAEGRKIQLVPGVELELDHPWPGVLHLLGLGFDPGHEAIGRIVAINQRNRRKRNEAMLERLVPLAGSAAVDEFRFGIDLDRLTRPHMADFLVDRGLCRNREEAFATYIGNGGPAWVSFEGLGVAEACEGIHAAGGVAVLAHPLSLGLGWVDLENAVEVLAAQGLDGLEAWHPTHRASQGERMAALAARKGLRTSAGSDYHGSKRPDRILGRSLGSNKPIDNHFARVLSGTVSDPGEAFYGSGPGDVPGASEP